MEIKIRQMREEDIPDLHRNVNNPDVCKYLMVSYPVPYEESMKHWKTRMADPNAYILVAEMDGRVVGMTDMIRKSREPVRHNAEMAIVIAKEYWKKGVGMHLMSAMKEKAKDMGIRRLALSLQKEHIAALRFYERCGFTVCGEKTHYIRVDDGYHNVIDMELLL